MSFDPQWVFAPGGGEVGVPLLWLVTRLLLKRQPVESSLPSLFPVAVDGPALWRNRVTMGQSTSEQEVQGHDPQVSRFTPYVHIMIKHHSRQADLMWCVWTNRSDGCCGCIVYSLAQHFLCGSKVPYCAKFTTLKSIFDFSYLLYCSESVC